MTKKLGLGLIPIALPLLVPLGALALTYDDMGDWFRNTINNVGAQPTREPYFTPSAPNEPTKLGATQYSFNGELTGREARNLQQNLRFPQNLVTLQKRFGSPVYVRHDAWWWMSPDGVYIGVYHDGNQALGFLSEQP